MTLGELLAREDLVGRVLKTHETTGYAFGGKIVRVGREGILVHFSLSEFVRCFEKGWGPWKHLPDSRFTLGKNAPLETAEDGTISFVIPRGGGRGYILPKGQKPPKPPVKEAV